MELMHFENEWREFCLFNGKITTSLRSMLVRSRGICTVDGHKAVNFQAANEDVDPMILWPVTDASGTTFCFRWDDAVEKWERIGCIVPANEWSANQLRRYWEDCAIQLADPKRIWKFRDIFSSCLGERHDGIAFVGNGRFDGENILIRLNCDKQLTNYYDDQVCEKYNEEKDEWEYWGMLIKHVPNR